LFSMLITKTCRTGGRAARSDDAVTAWSGAPPTCLGSTNVNTTLDYTVFKQPYTTPAEKVFFPSQLVHIALPNVHMPDKAVDIGAVKAGGEGTAKATIQNTGELGAKFTAKSSDSQFVVDAAEIRMDAKGSADLPITFKPNGAGPASAEITITSNDPDSPVQTFKVVANGGDASGTVHNGAPGDDAETGGASGCGCKTAGAPISSTTSSGGLLGLALGLGFIVRRRSRR